MQCRGYGTAEAIDVPAPSALASCAPEKLMVIFKIGPGAIYLSWLAGLSTHFSGPSGRWPMAWVQRI